MSNIENLGATYCTSVNMIALGTISINVRRVMLKYELIRSSGRSLEHARLKCHSYILMTSTSCPSFSDNVPEALS